MLFTRHLKIELISTAFHKKKTFSIDNTNIKKHDKSATLLLNVNLFLKHLSKIFEIKLFLGLTYKCYCFSLAFESPKVLNTEMYLSKGEFCFEDIIHHKLKYCRVSLKSQSL